jgi:hypothetical protein
MQKVDKYVIFKTKWGHFGLAGTESGLCRTYLPGPNLPAIKAQLLKNLPGAQLDRTLFKALQEQIAAYFEGTPQSFSPAIPLILDGMGDFSRSVLTACRNGIGEKVGPAGRKPGRRRRTGPKSPSPAHPLPPDHPHRWQNGWFLRPRRDKTQAKNAGP